MDLHRLRVVEFNTLVSEKEGRKKYVAELEEHKKKYKSNFDDKQYETIESENDSKCLDDKIWPQKAPQKFGDGVNIKYLVDKIGPPGTSKQCLAKDQASRTPTSRLSSFMKHKSKSEIFSITSKCKLISWKNYIFIIILSAPRRVISLLHNYTCMYTGCPRTSTSKQTPVDQQRNNILRAFFKMSG